MAERRISNIMIASATARGAVLLWAAISFAARPLEAPPTEAMPVDIIPITEFTQMMEGTKSAPKKEVPKPLVEKKDEPKPVEDHTAPVSEKPEIVTAAAPAAEPPPQEVKVPTPKPAPQPEKKEPAKNEPEKKQPDAEALKQAEEALKRNEKKEAKPVPRKKPEPKKLAEKPPTPEKSQFNADQIQALLDKRQPRRLAAVGETLSSAPSLGATRGSAPQLTMNEIDALRARIQQCWNPPAGQTEAKELTVLVRIQFNQDGSLATEPRLLTRPNPGYQQVAAESALRAIRRCAPYSFMPAAKYDAWKDIEVNFDPRELFRG